MTDTSAAPTSRAELQARGAELEALIQSEAAKSRSAASALPDDVEPPTAKSIATAPNTAGLSEKDKHLLLHAQFADIVDVMTPARMSPTDGQPPNAAFLNELHTARQLLGARPTSTSLAVIEAQMGAAMQGWNGKLQSYPAWCQMNGSPLTAEQVAAWSAATAQTRTEIAAASIAPEDRAIGGMHYSELPAEETHGYNLSAFGNAPVDRPVAEMLLGMAKSLGLSQAHVDSAIRHELKKHGR